RQMAGIVEAEQSPAIAVDLQTCDPGHGMPKAPELREVDREDVSEEGEDNEVVSDNADCVVGVALSERTDCSGRALLHIDEPFAARRSACKRPVSFRETSDRPSASPWRLESVSPWRTRKMSVSVILGL